MKAINKIVHDERTYIESMGKQDQENVREAIADKGVDTILRVCLGVTGSEMPVRALGYYASAIAVQEHYFPEAELQVVYPVHAASAINGVKIEQGKNSADDLDYVAHGFFPRRYRQDSPDRAKIGSFFDAEIPGEDLEQAVTEVLKKQVEISDRLHSSAKTRGANCAKYVAAHILMHDTNPTLLSLVGGELAGKSKRVISIGAQSERPFYLARMACQRARLISEAEQVATGQLFTRHVIAPYMSCREGEPTLRMEATIAHPVPSVQRDLEFLDGALKAEAVRYISMTVPVERIEYCVGKITVREFA